MKSIKHTQSQTKETLPNAVHIISNIVYIQYFGIKVLCISKKVLKQSQQMWENLRIQIIGNKSGTIFFFSYCPYYYESSIKKQKTKEK